MTDTNKQTKPNSAGGGLLAQLREKTRILTAGVYPCQIVPGSIKPVSRPGNEGAAFRAIVTGAEFKGRELSLELRSVFDKLPSIAERDIRIVLDIAETIGVDGASFDEIISNIADKLFPTNRNPNPAQLMLKIGARQQGAAVFYSIENATVEKPAQKAAPKSGKPKAAPKSQDASDAAPEDAPGTKSAGFPTMRNVTLDFLEP